MHPNTQKQAKMLRWTSIFRRGQRKRTLHRVGLGACLLGRGWVYYCRSDPATLTLNCAMTTADDATVEAGVAAMANTTKAEETGDSAPLGYLHDMWKSMQDQQFGYKWEPSADNMLTSLNVGSGGGINGGLGASPDAGAWQASQATRMFVRRNDMGKDRGTGTVRLGQRNRKGQAPGRGRDNHEERSMRPSWTAGLPWLEPHLFEWLVSERG